jgi:hypothetical protein
VVARTNKEFTQRFEPIIARVKRHDSHVETQENEAHRQPSLVEWTDIKPSEQDLVPVIQEDAHTRKHEYVGQYHRRLKWDVDVHVFKLPKKPIS